MSLLLVTGLYKQEDGRFVGGYSIAELLSQFTNDDIHLHTNFSTTEYNQTRIIKKQLRQQGIITDYAKSVAVDYGTLYADTFHAGSNLFETFKNNEKYLKNINQIILTTDINERDYRVVKNFAVNHKIPITVFTCNEFKIRNAENMSIVEVDDSGLPNYHLHKEKIIKHLQQNNIIDTKRVKHRNLPPTKINKAGKNILQLIFIGLGLFLVAYFGFLLMDRLSGTESHIESNIEWSQSIDHPDCQTVLECKALGDSYLDELSTYIDFGDEPHIFFENRSREYFIDYQVEGTELTDITVKGDLPADNEGEFIDLWHTLTRVFPEQYLDAIHTYRLFSDGEGNTAAFVSIERDGTTLGIDVRDNLDKPSKYRNLIHEFGHLYSLPIDDFTNDCDTTDLNCLKENTILDDFRNRFWSQYDEQWHENSGKSQAQIEGFYNNNVTAFYTPYQATNVKEDYAITFMQFITYKIPSNSSQLRDVKVQSMYENDDLVVMRVNILEAFLQLEKERAS